MRTTTPLEGENWGAWGERPLAPKNQGNVLPKSVGSELGSEVGSIEKGQSKTHGDRLKAGEKGHGKMEQDTD
jgi:hypothetical protein